ncbi:MAG: DNA-binding protein HU-beta, partial [uncultured Nocardioides sp.]
ESQGPGADRRSRGGTEHRSGRSRRRGNPRRRRRRCRSGGEGEPGRLRHLRAAQPGGSLGAQPADRGGDGDRSERRSRVQARDRLQAGRRRRL